VGETPTESRVPLKWYSVSYRVAHGCSILHLFFLIFHSLLVQLFLQPFSPKRSSKMRNTNPTVTGYGRSIRTGRKTTKESSQSNQPDESPSDPLFSPPSFFFFFLFFFLYYDRLNLYFRLIAL